MANPDSEDRFADTPAEGERDESAPASWSADAELQGPAAAHDPISDTAPLPMMAGQGEVQEDAATVISSPTRPLLTTPYRNTRELGAILQGHTLDEIRLDEFIGGGGMGAVFRGHDMRLGRSVAVKVVSGDRTDPDTLRRFHNEAQSAARLDHPNIARVYQVGEDSGWHYIVFEFIEGVNIRDLVEFKGPLPAEEALSYALQVAEALEHAFQRDVVHRDIKPSNVLVMPNGQVKLVDMGLARLHDVESPKDDITASGVTLGTFDYISPEQARDPRNADVRSDLYSLGCTLYFMLSGRPPFPEGTVLQKLLSHSSEPPPDVRLFRPDLEDELVSVLNRLMAKQPANRYQTPNAFIIEVHSLVRRMNMTLSVYAGVSKEREARMPSWPLQLAPWGVGFVLLAATAFGVEWLDRSGDLAGPETPKLEFAATASESPEPKPVASDASDPETSQNVARARTDPPVPSPPSEASFFVGNRSLLPVDWIDSKEPWPDDEQLAYDRTLSLAELRAVEQNTDEDPAPVAIRRIVVGPAGDAASSPDVMVSSDLNQAIEALGMHPTVDRIDLRFNGRMPHLPLRLVLSRPLTVAAAEGYEPILYFEPELNGAAPSRHAIEVAGEPLAMVGVHVHLRLPLDPADAWSMFYLDQAKAIDFTDCTLTIQNADESGIPRQPKVAFIAMRGKPVRAEMRMATDGAAAPPASQTRPPIHLIQASRTSVRGEADWLHAHRPESIALSWSGGLMAISGRIIELSGSPAFPDATVHADFERVTINAGRGLARVDMLDSMAPPSELHLKFSQSVIDVGGGASLVEHYGVETLTQAEKRFSYSGSENYYTAQVGNRWTVLLQDGQTLEFPFEEKETTWYQELSGVRAVMWKTDPDASRPFHIRQRDEYLQDARPANPSAKAGFDPAAIPPFPGNESRVTRPADDVE